MIRGIDHLVLCVGDLDDGRAIYERLGFTMTPRAQHPFGTGNSLAQLQGCFLEMLAVTEPENVPDPAPGHFSFAAFNEGFLDDREGLSMLVFRTADAEADRREWTRAGLHTYEPFGFERLATLPSGEQVTVGFSLAFVSDDRMPDAGFFSCQHRHPPEHFYKPDFQRHANTARGIAGIVMVADAPGDLVDFFQGVAGAASVTRDRDGLAVDLDGTRLDVLTPAALSGRFDDLAPPANPARPHFVGYAVAVADLRAVRAALIGGEVPHRDAGDRIWVAPEHGRGALIGFAAPT